MCHPPNIAKTALDNPDFSRNNSPVSRSDHITVIASLLFHILDVLNLSELLVPCLLIIVAFLFHGSDRLLPSGHMVMKRH